MRGAQWRLSCIGCVIALIMMTWETFAHGAAGSGQPVALLLFLLLLSFFFFFFHSLLR